MSAVHSDSGYASGQAIPARWALTLFPSLPREGPPPRVRRPSAGRARLGSAEHAVDEALDARVDSSRKRSRIASRPPRSLEPLLERVDRAASSVPLRASIGRRVDAVRWAKTSFSRSSERPSRTCSTGSAEPASDRGACPAGVARKIVRFGPRAPGSLAGRHDQPPRLQDLERAVDERPAERPDRAELARGRQLPASAHPCAGRSQSSASTAHSPGARSRSAPTDPVLRPPSAIGLPYPGSADDAGAAPMPRGRSASTRSMKSTAARVDSSRKRTNTRSVPVLARRRASSVATDGSTTARCASSSGVCRARHGRAPPA